MGLNKRKSLGENPTNFMRFCKTVKNKIFYEQDISIYLISWKEICIVTNVFCGDNDDVSKQSLLMTLFLSQAELEWNLIAWAFT
jgi:hypothetical protein